MELKEQIKSVLRYYKMETECPYEYGAKEHFFWNSEKTFMETCNHDDNFYQSWVTEARNYEKNNPDQKNPLTDPNTPEATKAIIIYIDYMLDKWRPQDREYIYEY